MAVPADVVISIEVKGISIHVARRFHFKTVPRNHFNRSVMGNHHRCFAIEQEEKQ